MSLSQMVAAAESAKKLNENPNSIQDILIEAFHHNIRSLESLINQKVHEDPDSVDFSEYEYSVFRSLGLKIPNIKNDWVDGFWPEDFLGIDLSDQNSVDSKLAIRDTMLIIATRLPYAPEDWTNLKVWSFSLSSDDIIADNEGMFLINTRLRWMLVWLQFFMQEKISNAKAKRALASDR